MTLQETSAALVFGGGVDTKSNAKQVVPTKLVDLQNCVFTNNLTLAKRNGFASLGQTIDGGFANYTKAARLGKRQSELVLFANQNAFGYRPSTSTWSKIGPCSSVPVQLQPIARTGTDQVVPDIATNGGITVAAWETMTAPGVYSGVSCSVVDATSGKTILAPVLLDASGLKPRCVACGGVVLVVWVNSVNIYCAVINPASASTVPVSTVLASGLDATQTYDICPTFDQFSATIRPAFIAFVSATSYTVGYVHPSGVIGSPVTGLPVTGTFAITPGASTRGIACAYWLTNPNAGSPRAMVAWTDTTNSLMYRFHDGNNLGSAALGTGTLTAIGGLLAQGRVTCEFADLDAAGNAIVWWACEQAAVTADLNQVLNGSVDAAGTVTVGTALRGHCLASRAFYDNGQVYCAVVYAVQFFPYVAIINLSGKLQACSRLLPTQTTGALVRNVMPAVSPLVGASGGTSRQHICALGYRIQLSGTSGLAFSEQGIYQATWNFNATTAYQTAELGLGMYIGGSLIQHYDGLRIAEADFHTAPDTFNGVIVTSQGGGGLSANSTYNYLIQYEEVDNQGEVHRSGTSAPVVITTGGGNASCTLTIPTYRLTSKLSVRIGVFRSQANTPGAFNRVSSTDPAVTGQNGYIANNTAVDTVSFTDSMSDATALGQEPNYTNSGILSDDPTSSGGNILVNGMSRLFWDDPINPYLIRHSQQIATGYSAEFCPQLQIALDPYGGSLQQLDVMDQNLIAWKQGAMYVVGGPGPLADGGFSTQQTWSPPQLITGDVGIASPDSTVSIPQGVMFQADKGFYLLGRDLSVSRQVGDDVYAYNGQTTVAAGILPGRPHVVFVCNGVDPTGNPPRTLLYDYDRQQWSTFTNCLGLDARVINGTFYYLRTDGRVFAETVGSYSDAGAKIPMLIRTAWVRFSDKMQAWQKVIWAQVLGDWESAHTLRMRYLLDFEPAMSPPHDVNVNVVYTPSTYGGGQYGGPGDGSYGGAVGVPSVVYNSSFHINKRCTAIAFQFEDIEAAPGPYGASFQLSELILTGGMLAPRKPLGANRSA